jgi:argininosuccinate synthase
MLAAAAALRRCAARAAPLSRRLSTAAAGSKGDVVLLYSGGLDTSTVLVWLREQGYGVHAYCANLGQEEDFGAMAKKALACGAKSVHIEDLRDDFLANFILPSIQANGIYENLYLMGTSLARPCIARRAVEIAHKMGCGYVAHGATGKGNDQVRFEMCAIALDAGISTIAPWRDPEFIEQFKGRTDLLAYAAKHNIVVDATPKAPYSLDANLFHTSYESGMLEDPMTPPVKDMFRMTVDPEDAPDKPTFIRIEFVKGAPSKVVNKTTGATFTDPLEAFNHLNEVAGANGVGRIDIVENRFVGIKSRGCYETPAGTVLREAHLDLEGITLDREVLRIRDTLAAEFSRLCYYGFWCVRPRRVTCFPPRPAIPSSLSLARVPSSLHRRPTSSSSWRFVCAGTRQRWSW